VHIDPLAGRGLLELTVVDELRLGWNAAATKRGQAAALKGKVTWTMAGLISLTAKGNKLRVESMSAT